MATSPPNTIPTRTTPGAPVLPPGGAQRSQLGSTDATDTTPGPYLLSVRGGFNGEERDLHSDAIHSEERRIFRPLYFASPHESRMTPRATCLLRPAHGELKQSMRTKPAWGKHKALAIRTFRHCTAYFRRWAIHKYTPHTPRRQMPPTHSFLSKHDNTIRV